MEKNERVQSTRSGLFAIELLLDIGIFTFCAAICVGLFVRSELISRDSADLTNAVRRAQSAAECYKAAMGDLTRTGELSGAAYSAENGVLYLYYDEDWKAVPEPAVYTLRMEALPGNTCEVAELTVSRSGETLLLWHVAALETETAGTVPAWREVEAA